MIPAKMTAVEGVDVKRSMALSRMRHAIQDRMKQGKNKDLCFPRDGGGWLLVYGFDDDFLKFGEGRKQGGEGEGKRYGR
eukprot:1322188-Amorphochlora_amoeboformis.AAC.1